MGQAAMTTNVDQNVRPEFDKVITDIADYVMDYELKSSEALETAYYCLLDTLGCGFLALATSESCRNQLGPVVEGAGMANGTPVPGTAHSLDPVKAAFDIGAMIRWLDYNDTWLAAEWGHPSDSLGAILAVADYMNRSGRASYTVKDVLEAMVRAHEIQGCLALENSFNKVGLDHVVLVKCASAAVAAKLLGLTKAQVVDVLSNVWVDGQSLRTYRHAPNAGSRKSWAAGDATSRAVRLALMVQNGEMGYPSALTAPKWGFYDVLFKGNEFKFQRDYGSYVMEHVLFKISYPTEYHAQTAAEAAVKLHDDVKDRLNDIERIELTTHEAAIRIISKTGELYNFADRDHCLQYIVAAALAYGTITEETYTDAFAAKDTHIDSLRSKMTVSEDKGWSADYHDPQKRAFANGVQVFFKDGSKTERVDVHYPVGHKKRREEGIPLLIQKFNHNVNSLFDTPQASDILSLCQDRTKLESMAVDAFMDSLRR